MPLHFRLKIINVSAFVEAYLLEHEHKVVGEICCKRGEENKEVKPSKLILQGNTLILFVHPTLPNFAGFDLTELVSILYFPMTLRFLLGRLHYCDRAGIYKSTTVKY